MPDHDRSDDQTTAGLLGDVVFGITQLIKGEFDLVRAEARRSLQEATSAIIRLVIAGVLGIVALNLLAAAAVAGLAVTGLGPAWSSLIVGVVVLLVAFVLIRTALPMLAASNLTPKRSFANLRQDAEILKTMVNPNATSDVRP